MKKSLFSIILIASLSCVVKIATIEASTGSSELQPVTVELIVNSPGADGSQFILNGLQTPAKPNYACAKTSTLSDASGKGSSVHFALVDVNGVDKVKITVRGTIVGNLSVTNDTYVNQTGNPLEGSVIIRQYEW